MAWVELVPIGLILLLVAWIFLRPYPQDKAEEQAEDVEQGSDSRELSSKDGKDSDHV